MINVNQLMRTGVNAITNNSPAILTAFGAVGVVGTAILTGKATFEAAKRISEAEKERSLELTGQEDSPFELTKTEKFQLVWPLYIGAVVSGATSCGAIVLSHRISSRRAAVIAAAYALNESKLEEYQEKIKEKFGVKKEKEARDELAQEKVTRDFESGTVVFHPHEGKVLVKDEYSGRYFYSTIEDVNRAVNEINREVLNSVGSYATLSAFYDAVGLESVSTSDYFGWNTNEMCDIDWSTTTTPDGKNAVHVFEFANPPIMNPGASSSFR
jgi:hypothetical protein